MTVKELPPAQRRKGVLSECLEISCLQKCILSSQLYRGQRVQLLRELETEDESPSMSSMKTKLLQETWRTIIVMMKRKSIMVIVMKMKMKIGVATVTRSLSEKSLKVRINVMKSLLEL